MILADQIKDLEQRSGALERCLNIEQKRIDLLNEEEKTQVPDFWDNPDQAREQLRRVAAIKAWVDDYDAVAKDVEDLALMPEFVKEGVVSEQEMDAHYAQTLERIEKLEMRNMLRRDEDKLGAILDINAGAGGTEALDWASMLLRMYTRIQGQGARLSGRRRGGGEVLHAGVRRRVCVRLPQERERRAPHGAPFALQRQQQAADDFRVGFRVARRGRYDRGDGESLGHRVGYVPSQRCGRSERQ